MTLPKPSRLACIACSQFFIAVLSSHGIQAQPGTEPKRVEGICTDKFTEFAPTISADGKTMILESNRNSTREGERWELFESIKNPDGSWSEAMPLTAINEKCHFLAGPSLSYDGNTIFFTAFIEGVSTSEDIFYSERLDKTHWGEPVNIGSPINTDDYEGFPSISADDNSLYFIRISYENGKDKVDRKSNENCFEIYVSHKKPDGKWGVAKKLPDTINTGCVRDPRIMADNHTLIFSAITSTGKGKYDLYQSRRNTDSTWTAPVPLDFINSEENDQSPTISAEGNVIFFCRKNDIYSMPIPEEYRQMINVTLVGYVRSASGGEPLPAMISILNSDTKEKIYLNNNPHDGRYSLVLSAGTPWRVEFMNPTHVKATMDFDLRSQDAYKEIDVDINLKSTYNVKILTFDKETNKPITAFVQLSDQRSGPIWKDSLRNGRIDSMLALRTIDRYNFITTANNYGEVNQSMTFNPEIFTPDTTLTFRLIHNKVTVATDFTDVTTNSRVRIQVEFNNTEQDEVLIVESDKSVLLRKGERYQVITTSDKGYFFSTSTIVAGEGELGPDGVYRHHVLLTPIREGASLILNNITFESNSAELRKSSFSELNRVIELMHQNSSLVIEIAAHTDDIGTDDYNLKLSQRRAKSVATYLKAKGIVNKRFEAKGFGKSKPLTHNENEEGRSMNRRVELIILRL